MAGWDASMRIVVIRNGLPAASRQAKGGMAKAVNASADRIAANAKARAKRRTGHMADSVDVERSSLSGKVGATVHAPAYYSGFLDLGTRAIPPDRWFTGAVDLERARYGETLRDLFFWAGEGRLE